MANDAGLDLQLKGSWNELKGALKEAWGNLTDDDMDVAEGNVQQLFGRVQAKTGEGIEAIADRMDRFLDRA